MNRPVGADESGRAARRAKLPVRVYRLGEEPSDDLRDVTTPEERIAMMWPLAVEAGKLGAFDFLTKPFRNEDILPLLARIAAARCAPHPETLEATVGAIDQTVVGQSAALTRRRVRWLPTAYCFYGFRDPGLFFTRCDSNGCAAGSTLEEAILYGFLELVERDAVALWWYNRVRPPAVDADSFGLTRCGSRMKRHYQDELGRELHAIDITSDLGIPTVGVVSRRLGGPVEDIIVGFASHLDPAAALLRALEEASQSLPSVRERAPDGSTVYRLYSPETIWWWKTATYDNQPYLLPDPAAPVRTAADFASRASRDVRTDVLTCLAAAERCGLEVLVLDQTRPHVGLPVAKVVVPPHRFSGYRKSPRYPLSELPLKLLCRYRSFTHHLAYRQ